MAKKTTKKVSSQSIGQKTVSKKVGVKNATVKKTTSKSATRKMSTAKKVAVSESKENPPRNEVKPLVIRCIYDEAIDNDAHIHKPDKVQLLLLGTEDLILETDLLIGSTRRGALSQCYDGISHGIHKGGRITPSMSKKATLVGAAIDLVHIKANDK